jgi:hypothetical protein
LDTNTYATALWFLCSLDAGFDATFARQLDASFNYKSLADDFSAAGAADAIFDTGLLSG